MDLQQDGQAAQNVAALSADSAIALILKLASGFELRPMSATDVRKMVETELRVGRRVVEVYVGVHQSRRAEGPGVSLFRLHEGHRGWTDCGGISSMPAATNRPEDLDAAIDALEQRHARYRPVREETQAVPRVPRRAAAVPVPVNEAEGAGALGEVEVFGEEHARRATHEQIDEAERALGTRFPAGYRTFAVCLGEGRYGDRVHVQMPKEVLGELQTWREATELHWPWDHKAISHTEAFESVVFAYLDGEALIFHPLDPDAIYRLPRVPQQARLLGRGLARALANLVRSKHPVFEAFPKREASPPRDVVHTHPRTQSPLGIPSDSHMGSWFLGIAIVIAALVFALIRCTGG